MRKTLLLFSELFACVAHDSNISLKASFEIFKIGSASVLCCKNGLHAGSELMLNEITPNSYGEMRNVYRMKERERERKYDDSLLPLGSFFIFSEFIMEKKNRSNSCWKAQFS